MTSSNAATTELLCTWTTDFDVHVNTASRTLLFTPAMKDRVYIRPRSLFSRPGTGERSYQNFLSGFLSLSPDSSAQQWQEVATRLGPLFAQHPLHHVMVGNPSITESIDHWLIGRDTIYALWNDIHELSNRSSSQANEPTRPQDLAPMSEESAFDPTQSEEPLNLLHGIGTRLNTWFLDPHPRLTPLLNPNTLQMELVVPQGIQALLLMSIALARADMAAFPNRCARPGCRTVAFMKGRRLYCSERCQTAHKQIRYRERRLQQRVSDR